MNINEKTVVTAFLWTVRKVSKLLDLVHQNRLKKLSLTL